MKHNIDVQQNQSIHFYVHKRQSSVVNMEVGKEWLIKQKQEK